MLQWTLYVLTSENCGISVGIFLNFVWVTIREKFLSNYISVKEENIEIQLTGMVIYV